jgi:Glycosyltransferase like family
MAARRAPVSIICVYNDPETRRGCLDCSIEEHRDEGTFEYLPIDNVGGSYATAAAALNRGASLASHDCLVFVHQDVYLHSLRALGEAAAVLADDKGIGLLGATGVGPAGETIGRIRDRVVVHGRPARQPTDVDSLDEVLFMVPRRLFQREPLSDAPELAWHAYAIEYGLRARSLGLRVCAVDIPLTHNSLTVNLDGLHRAYAAVASKYPDALPVRASCGTITAPSHVRPGARLLQSHRWRYRWLRESVAAHSARRAVRGGRSVLADIRFDIDEVLSAQRDSPLLVVNIEHEHGFTDEGPGPLRLMRRGRPILLTFRRARELADMIAACSSATSLLLTDLRVADLRSLTPSLPPVPRLLGFRREVGHWMLLGPAAEAAPLRWRQPDSTPLGMQGLARSAGSGRTHLHPLSRAR